MAYRQGAPNVETYPGVDVNRNGTANGFKGRLKAVGNIRQFTKDTLARAAEKIAGQSGTVPSADNVPWYADKLVRFTVVVQVVTLVLSALWWAFSFYVLDLKSQPDYLHRHLIIFPDVPLAQYRNTRVDVFFRMIFGGINHHETEKILALYNNGWSASSYKVQNLDPMPVYPVLLRLTGWIVAPLKFLVETNLVMVGFGFVLNTLLMACGAKMMEKLTLQVLKDAGVARMAAYLFALHPVAIDYASVHPRALFSLLILAGMYHFEVGNELLAVLCWSLATGTQAQGMANVIFVLYRYYMVGTLVALASAAHRDKAWHLARALLRGGLFAFLTVAPYIWYNVFLFVKLCIEAPHLETSAVYAEVGIRGMCSASILGFWPHPYAYLQWDSNCFMCFARSPFEVFMAALFGPLILAHLWFIGQYFAANRRFCLSVGAGTLLQTKGMVLTGAQTDGGSDVNSNPRQKKRFSTWEHSRFVHSLTDEASLSASSPAATCFSVHTFPYVAQCLGLLAYSMLTKTMSVFPGYVLSQSPIYFWFLASLLMRTHSQRFSDLDLSADIRGGSVAKQRTASGNPLWTSLKQCSRNSGLVNVVLLFHLVYYNLTLFVYTYTD